MKIFMDNATVTNKATGDALATVSVHGTGHASPSAARMREIVGIQLGILDVIRLFLQVNTAVGSPTLTSVAGGLRLAI